MTVSKAAGFAKQVGLGDFVSNAIGKVKGLFRSAPEGPVTMKLRPLSERLGRMPAAPAAAPKMEMLRGSHSIKTPMRPSTPQQAQSTRIRSEMKRGIGGAP